MGRLPPRKSLISGLILGMGLVVLLVIAYGVIDLFLGGAAR